MTASTLLCGFILAGSVACSAGSGAASGDGYPAEPLVALASNGGAYKLEVRTAPNQPPSRGTNSADILVTTQDGTPAEGLAVSVDPWMPAMGHGSSVQPTVTESKDGHYDVTNLHFFMPGEWELRIKLDGETDDAATLSIDIP